MRGRGKDGGRVRGNPRKRSEGGLRKVNKEVPVGKGKEKGIRVGAEGEMKQREGEGRAKGDDGMGTSLRGKGLWRHREGCVGVGRGEGVPISSRGEDWS